MRNKTVLKTIQHFIYKQVQIYIEFVLKSKRYIDFCMYKIIRLLDVDKMQRFLSKFNFNPGLHTLYNGNTWL